MMVTDDQQQEESELPGFSFPLSRPGVFLVGLFLFAGLNAVSFFLHTAYPWRRLFGETKGILLQSFDVQIGFPLPIAFRPGVGFYQGQQWAAFAGNVICAIVVSAVCAAIWGKHSKPDCKAGESSSESTTRRSWQIRFRLIHMLATTTVIAVLLSLFAHAPEPSVRALKLIYLAGPCLIVWVFYSLRHRSVLRATTLSIVLLLLIASSAKFAAEAFGDFTFGLFGMFVCWLPQFLMLLLWLIISQNLKNAAPAEVTS